MRSKNVLKDFEDILVLYQFLYMNPESRIVINNGMTDLEIRLDENLQFYCKNLSFPHLPDLFYSAQMTLSCCLGAIDYLQKQQPAEFPDSFNSRWDEIKTMTNSTMAANFYTTRGAGIHAYPMPTRKNPVFQ